MFQAVCFKVFQMFQRYITSVLYRCCKSRSGYCTYCNGYTRMIQVYVPNVSSVSDVCCKFFIWNVAMQVFRVFSYVCCKCFIWMFAMATHMFSRFFWCFCKCFKRMLQVFQLFWTYVASISSGCCKIYQDFANVTMGLICRSCMLQLLGRRRSPRAVEQHGRHSSNVGPYGLEKRGAGIGFRTPASVRTSRL
jgi:hypothetical protein